MFASAWARWGGPRCDEYGAWCHERNHFKACRGRRSEPLLSPTLPDEDPRRFLLSRVVLLGLPGGVVPIRHSAVLVSSSFSPLCRERRVAQQMRRLSLDSAMRRLLAFSLFVR
jgi:hypothetical protein